MALVTLIMLGTAGAGQARETEPPATAYTSDARGTATAEHHPAPIDPWASPEIAAPQMDPDVLKRPAVAASTGGAPPQRAHPWLRTSASLAGVVALIVLLAWGYRLGTRTSLRFPLSHRGRSDGLIQVLSRTNLAPRQSLCLVRIGPQLVLIGATHDSLRALAVVDDPELAARLAGQEAGQHPDSHLAEFRHCLDTAAEDYTPVAAQDEADPLHGPPVIDLKQKLSQTVRRLQAVAGQA